MRHLARWLWRLPVRARRLLFFTAVGLFLVLVGSRLRLAHQEINPNVAPLLVLLIGTWFDGVLFRIPLAVPFWVLLLAGTGDLSEVMACPRLTGEPSQQAKD